MTKARDLASNSSGSKPTLIDAKGDLLVGTAADTAGRLAVGTNGHTLVADSSVSPTGLKWAVDPVADVVTTAGDLIYGTAADTVARLGIGTAGQVLKVNSGATAPEWGAVAGGGKVLQVISGSTTTETTIASTTLTDTTLSATITPTLATSKILILVSQCMQVMRDSNQAAGGLSILRGATSIYNASDLSLRIYVDGTTIILQRTLSSLLYLDSPSTTSATTYKTQAKSSTTLNTASVVLQPNSQPSTMILLEIGA